MTLYDKYIPMCDVLIIARPNMSEANKKFVGGVFPAVKMNELYYCVKLDHQNSYWSSVPSYYCKEIVQGICPNCGTRLMEQHLKDKP